MIYRNLLLILIPIVSGKFPNQDSGLFYQAEKSDNVTIEWHFAFQTIINVSSLKIHCVQLPELNVFYHLDNSVIEAQHEQFAGRVQCDIVALKAGLVRLHLVQVRTEDSAVYLCRMASGYGRRLQWFTLDINSTREQIGPTQRPEAVKRRRIIFYIGLGLLTVASALLAVCVFFIKHHTLGCLK